MLAPVELARVDYDASEGCAVTSDPFCSRVDDDIRSVLDGLDEVSSSTECVVNLYLSDFALNRV